MSAFTKILGNQKNISHLKEASEKGKLSHAYIINGEAGSGKKTFAEIMAASLLCSQPGENGPCGHCSACVKMISGNHPDLVHLKQKKEGLISVEDVRNGIIEDISIKPYYGPYKIYIVTNAHQMNVNAQNALLKTIEEPPEYGIIFLLTENSDMLLDTVRSRCVKLDMEKLPDELIRTTLEGRGAGSSQEISEAVAFARGNLGKALEICGEDGNSLALLRSELSAFLADLDRKRADEIFAYASELEKENDDDVTDLIQMWIRDILTVKSCGNTSRLYFPAQKGRICDLASHMTFEQINDSLDKAKKLEKRLGANVKGVAAYEAFLLMLRRNYR